MELIHRLTTIALLTALFGLSARYDAVEIPTLLSGVVVFVAVLRGWWRRLVSSRDPLRSMTPPAGPLRLAPELIVRISTD